MEIHLPQAGRSARDDDPGEDRLLRQWREGDADAFVALCGRHDALLRGRIERRLPRSVRRRVSISDVLQEAQVDAYAQGRTLEARGAGAFGRWMLAIVENKALMAVRRHHGAAKRNAQQELTRGRRADTAHARGRGATPSQEAIASELAALARESMRALPEDYREVLRLARDEHLPLAEVGERMGRSREAAKKLYARAIARFAAELRTRGGATHA